MRGQAYFLSSKPRVVEDGFKLKFSSFQKKRFRETESAAGFHRFLLTGNHLTDEQRSEGSMDPVEILASLRHATQKNRFEVFAVEVKPSEDYSEMSSRFCYMHYDEVPEKVIFTDPVGRDTEIVFLKSDRKIYMGGWKQLGEFYGLYLGGHMTLMYLGQGRFYINVFNNYENQVVYPPLHYQNSLGLLHVGSSMIPTPNYRQMAAPHVTIAQKGPCVNAQIIFQANVRAANQAITGIIPPPIPNFPLTNFVQFPEGVSENLIAQSHVGPSGVEKDFFLMFLKTVMPVDMERNAMVLPKQFATLALPLESTEVKLVDSDGTKWSCYIHWETGSQYYCTLTRGWSKFRTMKGFKIGDNILLAVNARNSDVLCFIENCKELPRPHQFW